MDETCLSITDLLPSLNGPVSLQFNRCQYIGHPAQATAVFEVLDDLRESVWRSYGSQIQQILRMDRTVTNSPIRSNLDQGDAPFLDRKGQLPKFDFSISIFSKPDIGSNSLAVGNVAMIY